MNGQKGSHTVIKVQHKNSGSTEMFQVLVYATLEHGGHPVGTSTQTQDFLKEWACFGKRMAPSLKLM